MVVHSIRQHIEHAMAQEIVEAGLLGASVPHGLPDNVHQAPLDPPASVDFVPKSSGEYQNGHLLSWVSDCQPVLQLISNVLISLHNYMSSARVCVYA